jgi:hypothetical protein
MKLEFTNLTTLNIPPDLCYLFPQEWQPLSKECTMAERNFITLLTSSFNITSNLLYHFSQAPSDKRTIVKCNWCKYLKSYFYEIY